MFTDGFTIKHSFVDYGLHVKKRHLGVPKKNSIRKKIPFMSGFYDFTKINGNIAWGERTLSYTFDIIGDTPEEVETECTRILNWLGNIHDADIYDDTMVGYHLHGSYDDATPSESEDGEHTELTVSFVCHPFKISNNETVVDKYRGTDIKTIKGQPVRPTVEALTGGYWYYRPNGAPIEENRRADLWAGVQLSPYVLGEGEYIFGTAPSNQIVAPFTEATHTDNGITFTVNGDGTIVANGTATGVAWFYLRGQNDKFVPPVGNHNMTGCPTGGGSSTFRMQAYVYKGESADPVYYYDYGTGGVVTVDDKTEYVSIAIRIASGYTANNLVFTPALYGSVKISWNEEVL